MKRTLRRGLCVLLAVGLLLCLSACGNQQAGEKDRTELSAEGVVGQAVPTLFFDFTVNSAQRAEEYEQHTTGQDGTGFVVVNITVANTSQEAITMYDGDFTLDTGSDTPAWVYDAFTDTMLPAQDTLAAGESRTYDLVFPVPQDKTSLALLYTENYTVDGAQGTGATYTVPFTA